MKLTFSSEISPGSEKMDISDTSNSSQGYDNTSQVLRLSNPVNTQNLDNDKLDNYTTAGHNTNLPTQSATNSHPLMYSPTSPISPDYPDLIPEKPKNKNNYLNYEKHSEKTEGHTSTSKDNIYQNEETFQKHLNLDLPSLNEYNEKLPGSI